MQGFWTNTCEGDCRFGFVSFYSAESAKAAREAMQHTQVDGRRVEVNWATRRTGPPRNRPPPMQQQQGGAMGMGMGMGMAGAAPGPAAWGGAAPWGYGAAAWDPNAAAAAAAAAWPGYYQAWQGYYGQPAMDPAYAQYYAQYYAAQQQQQQAPAAAPVCTPCLPLPCMHRLLSWMLRNDATCIGVLCMCA